MRASLSGKKHCLTLLKSCASLDPAQLNKASLLGKNQAVPGGGIEVNRYRVRPAQSTPQCRAPAAAPVWDKAPIFPGNAQCPSAD